MRTYGLIGYPLGHSFSRRFFTEKFEQLGKNEQYLNFEIPEISLLPGIISENQDLLGLNVTIPYKTAVIPFLDELDDIAAAIGAVNTILIERVSGENIRLKGYNTDVYGFMMSLRPLLCDGHNHALVLGTGGASKAVHYALKELGITSVPVSRNEGNAGMLTYDRLNREIIDTHRLIINTTPLGTYPDTGTFPEIPYAFITPEHLLYDLVYNPPLTSFLERGQKQGAAVKNGYEMLELQALQSYAIWNGLQD
jgi:shikimate dehydrogenase